MAISIGSAVGAGFNLVGRRPISVVGWGFFTYATLFALLGIGAAIVGLPVLQRLAALRGQTPDPTQFGQMMLGMLIALWPALVLVMIGALFVGAVVQGAVIRSVLTPDERGFASLRFGRAELALVLLALLYVPIFLAAVVVSSLYTGAIVAAGHLIHGLAGGLLVFVACVAYAVGFMWVALRFSLAAPMTFTAGAVRFLGSWTLTKGEGWRLFWMAWLLVLIWFAVSIAYSIVSSIVNVVFTGAAMASIVASAGASSSSTAGVDAMMAHWPILALAVIPSLLMGAAFNGLIQAISQGPWVDVYRQLKGSPDVAATFS
ncbi:MAG TPA: hypothetical protein VN694_09155 [Caulobacteraceae bacterium]|nr:hypothetical protein [Caulobacteraceae bacterium]